jgi:integrase
MRKPGIESNLVFCTPLGGPLEATNFVKQSFLPLLTRAGLPRIRFHEPQPHGDDCHRARRAHQPVSEMLGHASISMTLDVYSHVIPSIGGHTRSFYPGPQKRQRPP